MFTVKTIVLIATITSGLISTAYGATPLYILKINVDTASLGFLINTQQDVAIAFANPLSENNTTIVVSMAFKPFSSSTTQINFDSPLALYMSVYCPVSAFDVINMAFNQANVDSTQAYSFNGATITGSGSGTGTSENITIYYNAYSSSLPVTTGLAQYIYDNATGVPSTPLPINYYTLYPFETLLIPKPNSTVWAFIASNITNGSVLPVNILKPVSGSAQVISSNGGASSATQTTTLQISRYLPVDLNASSETTIHFDLSTNAFAYGPYPSP